MVWQAIVIVLQILMLSVSWLLFQQARSELNAQAAEAPVLTEVKTLQHNVRQLLDEMEQSSERNAVQLEARCGAARQLLSDLEQCLQSIEVARQEDAFASTRTLVSAATSDISGLPSRLDRHTSQTLVSGASRGPVAAGLSGSPSTDRDHVYMLADRGHTSIEIAKAVSMSEGQVETLIGLRSQQRR